MTFLAPVQEKKDDDVAVVEEEEEDIVFDQTPVRVICPHCGLNIITFIEHEASWVTYTVSMGLLLVLGWAAICVVPVVYPLFKDVVHHCPRCLSVLATRSRVAVSSFKSEVMSFRFGSCVIVLARKYALLLFMVMALIGGIHFMRNSGAGAMGIDAVKRSAVSPLGWQDFSKDCGFKSYLGNPIHVTMAFGSKYKNHTFHWEGTLHHTEEGFHLLWWSQRGAAFVRMNPAQFTNKRDAPDLVILYDEGDPKLVAEVAKLKHGSYFGFEGTMVEVGRRGSPHIMALWEIFPATEPKRAEANSSAILGGPVGGAFLGAAGGA